MKHLQRDLDYLKKEILLMGSMVEEATNKALSAFLYRRPELALAVIEGDDRIDQKELDVEEECLKLLALHQPVAADLRFIIAVMKVNNDLERMGDEAYNIAERVSYLSAHEPIGVPADFPGMVDRVRTMVRESLDALVNRDTALARKVCNDDDLVDSTHREMYMALQERMRENPDVVERAVRTLSISRHLERIADLATNIAEDVVFMVDGDVIRHRFRSRAAQPNGGDAPNARRSG
jgi:phosphate transport system protein